MSTTFIYDPTGFTFVLARDPGLGFPNRRDLQVSSFQSAAGRIQALARKQKTLVLSFDFSELKAQEEADLTHFHSEVARGALNPFRIQMKALVATAIACGDTFGNEEVKVGQNLSEIDSTLPAEEMVCGKLYHGQRTITLSQCRFEAGSFRSSFEGGDQRTGYSVGFTLICEGVE